MAEKETEESRRKKRSKKAKKFVQNICRHTVCNSCCSNKCISCRRGEGYRWRRKGDLVYILRVYLLLLTVFFQTLKPSFVRGSSFLHEFISDTVGEKLGKVEFKSGVNFSISVSQIFNLKKYTTAAAQICIVEDCFRMGETIAF